MTPNVLHQLQAKVDALRQRDASDVATNVTPAQRAAQTRIGAAGPLMKRPAAGGLRA